MFGNTMGWIISAVIAMIAAFATHALIQAGIPTPPSEFATTALQPLTLASKAAPFLKTTDTTTDTKADAGALYLAAIDDYEKHTSAYEALQREPDYAKAKAAADQLPGLVNLLKAADARCIGIFAGEPGAIINSEENPEVLQAIDALGKTAGMVSALAKMEKDYPTARAYGRALLVLGVRLYQERLAYLELDKGITLISTGIGELQSIDDTMGNSPDAAGDTAFKTQYTDESKNVITPIHEKFATLSQTSNDETAGDMFVIATGSNYDRMWRVEAIHHLARLQFNSDNMADQVKAGRVLNELTNDPDPIIHLAAENGLKMTKSEFQSLR